MNVIYIIPGFGQKTSQKEYREVISLFRARNFAVRPIRISWGYHIMSDYSKEFLKQLNHKPDDRVYLFGFSFGAMIAFITAAQLKPRALYLCSLSPYFKEDLPSLKKWWKKYWGKQRMKDFHQFSFNKLAKEIRCKTILIVGDKEGEEVMNRAKDARKRIKNATLIVVKGAKHNLAQKEYLGAVRKIITSTVTI